MTSTTNYGFYEPLVNSPTDSDLWGGELNTNLTQIDSMIYTAMNLTATAATNTITVTAATAGSTTTGSSKLLYNCNATGGAFAANLPVAATATNMVVAFRKTDASANAITVTGHAAELINGANTFSISSQYSFLVLVCDGTGWDIISQTAPSGKSFSTNIQTFTSSGTYTPSAGMASCVIELVAAGGNGGVGAAGAGGGGGGGGGGEYRKGQFSSATVGASQSITLGAVGNNSTVGSLLTAVFGSNGSAGGSNPASAGGAGGAGGSGGFGIPGQTGQPGSFGAGAGAGAFYVISGQGGNSNLGFGGQSVGSGTGTSAMANSGGGGSGGVTGSASGGAGATGRVIVTEFIYA